VTVNCSVRTLDNIWAEKSSYAGLSQHSHSWFWDPWLYFYLFQDHLCPSPCTINWSLRKLHIFVLTDLMLFICSLKNAVLCFVHSCNWMVLSVPHFSRAMFTRQTWAAMVNTVLLLSAVGLLTFSCNIGQKAGDRAHLICHVWCFT
jgi:hypothetical protein